MTTFLLIFKLVPGFFRLRFKLELGKLSRRLAVLEKRAAQPGAGSSELLEEVDAVDTGSAGLWVPRSQSTAYLELRQYVHDMRDRLSQREE